MTEVWFRNPNDYVRELASTNEVNVAWDRGQIVRSKVDVVRFSDTYFGINSNWRSLAIGLQGAAEYRNGDEWFKPTAVYPVWEYGEDFSLLEEMLEYPVGENVEACADQRVPGDERPVFGQEHRVVIVGIPSVTTGPGRAFISELMSFQEEYPNAIIHLHALYSYRVMFGLGFKAADVDPRTTARKGEIVMPNGRCVSPETAMSHHLNEIRRFGYKPVDLKDAKNRCVYNIMSAVEASKNWEAPVKRRRHRLATDGPVDSTSSDSTFVVAPGRTVSMPKGQPGDKVTCDTCSLFADCDFAREGAVCTLPGAEPKSLASHFKTRDSSVILDGLSRLLVANTGRLERAMEVEERVGDTDKDVTKLMGQVFEHGVKFAKLVDPTLAKPSLNVNIGIGGNQNAGDIGVSGPSPRELAAGFIRELEAQGIPRNAITTEMIQAMALRRLEASRPAEITAAPEIVEAEVVPDGE